MKLPQRIGTMLCLSATRMGNTVEYVGDSVYSAFNIELSYITITWQHFVYLFMDRCRLKLDISDDKEDIPTDQRIKAVQNGGEDMRFKTSPRGSSQ